MCVSVCVAFCVWWHGGTVCVMVALGGGVTVCVMVSLCVQHSGTVCGTVCVALCMVALWHCVWCHGGCVCDGGTLCV